MRVLWKKDSASTKSLLEAIVKEFNMSRKHDDFVCCGRRASSSIVPMELCGT